MSCDDDDRLPCVEGLIAATFALMTCWADPGAQRGLLAKKIASNLLLLREHPHLSPRLKRVMANAQEHWVAIARSPAAASETAKPVLH